MIVQEREVMGVEVLDIDLASALQADTINVLRKLYAEHGLLFFRDQHINPEKHIEIARWFGDINVNRFFPQVPDQPLIAEVRKSPEEKYNIGEQWHTDHSYDQIPAMGSILYAHSVPESGGNTLFANMYAAFDALPEAMKTKLFNMRAEHSSRHNFGKVELMPDEVRNKFRNLENAVQDAVHPVVIRHPLSGKPALYVNPDFTLRFEGLSKPESQPLLDELYAHSIKPEFVETFKWQKGSIAFWDNRASMHRAMNDYHGQLRLMHRITLEGEALYAA